MTTILAHLRSNAVAYLALFVALGGTSYAAISLPAGSVGAKQIHNGAITPVKLNGNYTNGTIRAWAIVSAKGTVLGGGGKPSAQLSASSPGTFIVRWAVPVSSRCETVANVVSSLSPTTETVPIPGGSESLTAGYVVVGLLGPASGSGGALFVTTFDQTGQPTPLAFHIAAIC
jgi:hypothetical protein